MEPLEADATTPSFCMLELSVHGDDVVYAFLYNGTRFFVTITAEKLEGEGELPYQLNSFREDIDDPDNMFLFEEWVLGALDDFIRQAAPTRTADASKINTLLEYLSPPTFNFCI
ncbi:hypothetical protein ED733_007577 [Metarhizium rileyi]|uniref:Uncharacterized protein n=1 Tax=Metarhizium rileyi (strain RCEF 4871) TaxID=1649241 RepID=A0A5C6GGR1_METRR|nr:hypothetical protein ED733_007577 [Metarhizium rileyi]